VCTRRSTENAVPDHVFVMLWAAIVRFAGAP